MDSLDLFYAMAKLRYSSELGIQRNLVDNAYQTRLKKEVRALLDQPLFQQNPLFKIYRLILDLFDERTLETYWKLKELVRQHLDLARDEEQLIILELMISHASFLSVDGHTDLIKDILEWYQLGLETKVLIESDQIVPEHFKNILNTAAALERYDFIEDLVENYFGYVKSPRQQLLIQHLSAGYLAFGRGEYEETLKIFNENPGINDRSYKLRARTLTIQCHYELGDVDLGIISCDNFADFLVRANMSSGLKEANRNFIRIIRKLFNYPYKGDAPQIREEFDKLQPIVSKVWLARKIEQL